jgi:hypothetical protein
LVGVIAKNCQIYDFKANQWLILDIVEFTKDIKNWVRDCLLKWKNKTTNDTTSEAIFKTGYNACIEEIRKKIEEEGQ